MRGADDSRQCHVDAGGEKGGAQEDEEGLDDVGAQGGVIAVGENAPDVADCFEEAADDEGDTKVGFVAEESEDVCGGEEAKDDGCDEGGREGGYIAEELEVVVGAGRRHLVLRWERAWTERGGGLVDERAAPIGEAVAELGKSLLEVW